MLHPKYYKKLHSHFSLKSCYYILMQSRNDDVDHAALERLGKPQHGGESRVMEDFVRYLTVFGFPSSPLPSSVAQRPHEVCTVSPPDPDLGIQSFGRTLASYHCQEGAKATCKGSCG